MKAVILFSGFESKFVVREINGKNPIVCEGKERLIFKKIGVAALRRSAQASTAERQSDAQASQDRVFQARTQGFRNVNFAILFIAGRRL